MARTLRALEVPEMALRVSKKPVTSARPAKQSGVSERALESLARTLRVLNTS